MAFRERRDMEDRWKTIRTIATDPTFDRDAFRRYIARYDASIVPNFQEADMLGRLQRAAADVGLEDRDVQILAVSFATWTLRDLDDAKAIREVAELLAISMDEVMASHARIWRLLVANDRGAR